MGALGTQYSFLKREGAVTLSDNSFDFTEEVELV